MNDTQENLTKMTILLVEYQPQTLSGSLGNSLCSTSRALGGAVGAGEGRAVVKQMSIVAKQMEGKDENPLGCRIKALSNTPIRDICMVLVC